MNAVSQNPGTCFNCFAGIDGQNPCPNCGFDNFGMEVKPQQLPPGTILHEGVMVGHVLGQGGFGITYLGYDLVGKRRVAVKEYFPAGMVVRQNGILQATSNEHQASFNRGLESFNKEARILSKLGNLPNIVNVHSFFFENGTGYFVMEFVEGQTLKDYLTSRGGKLDFPETLRLLLPVAQALQAVHHEGMLHRDIAPDNIFVTQNGQTKLMDFGAARFHVFQETQSVRTIVKPGYAPMEQYASQSAQGPWTDVYALGATFYRTLTGKVPLDAPTRSLHDELQSPLQLGCHLPKNADYAIMRAMSPQIMFRFRTVSDFIRVLTLPDSISPVSQYIPVMSAPVEEPLAPPPVNTEPSPDQQEDLPSWILWVVGALLLLMVIWFIWILISTGPIVN